MDIAIIGQAVEVPGACDPQALWELVTAGRSLARPFPARRRQDIDEFVRHQDRVALGQPPAPAGPEYHRASYLDRIDLFDHEFFGMTQAQAALTDPHQRLILRTAYRALEDAGYVGERVRGSRTGVFVGFAANPGGDYAQYWSTIDSSVTQLGITGTIPAMLANRLSYVLDLRGPSMVVDSACSASLVAVHLARTALLADDCDLAVVAGARVMLLPVRRASTRIGIESTDGTTRTFDDSADGTGMGEGSGALVLKRLDRALADRDQVLAVIKGSAVNHDGGSESMTGPDAPSQARLLTSAWRRAGIDPRTLGYLEVHGTATRLGDPVEIDGLTQAFRGVTDERGFCAVGTVKTTVGHLFEGSGVLGMIKAVQGLRNRQIAPLSYLERPNPDIDFAASPVRLPTALEPWPERDGVRRCGVSAFGLGGTNAHVVLEEYVDPAGDRPAGDRPGSEPDARVGYLFTVSARTDRSLRLILHALRDRLARGDLDRRLADVCYTANVSRSHHPRRVGLVVRSIGELRDGLAAVLAGGPPPARADQDARDRFLERLRVRWQHGEDVDLLRQFAGGHPGPAPRTVSLVPYRFDETRAWVPFPDDWEPRLLGDGGPVAQSGAYQVTFVPVDGAAKATAPGSVTALVDRDAPEAGARLTAALPGVRLVSPPPADPDAPDRFAAITDRLVADEPTHLVFALGFEPRPAADLAEFDRRVEKNVVGLFRLAKELMRRAAQLTLVVLTRNALPVSPGRGAVAENAALAGLAKTLIQEYPALNVRLVDTDDATTGEVLGQELLADAPGVYALRDGVRYAERFSEIPELTPRADLDAPLDSGLPRPGGAYLITGGTGGLGLAIGHRFAQQAPGVHLYLTGRTPLPPRREWERLAYDGGPLADRARALLDLVALGADVRVEAGDAGDEQHLTDLVSRIRREHGRLDGVVHAAGVPGENLIMFRAVEDFRRVLRPKMRGGYLLAALTRHDPPDFVVHMASAAAVFPSLGQADYAAANYYLDTLAMAAPAAGPRVLAIDWVAWRDTGMAVATGANEDGVFRALRTQEGLDLLMAGLRSDHRRFLAGRIDYTSELVAMLPAQPVALSDEIAARVDAAAVAAADRLEQLAARNRAAIQAVAVELVGRPGGEYSDVELTVARCLAHATGARTVPIDADLRALGVDSLGVVAVTSNLSSALGLRIDPVDLLGAASVQAIAETIEAGYATAWAEDHQW
jgi:3-oxoacyl-(acyl-carrier-protein) synthase/NAD(P)-dependent dehydrogenase (short-subunit alcohol dehydrogenase family)/acyl carrier protein